jgi:hypothetical protein
MQIASLLLALAMLMSAARCPDSIQRRNTQ